MTCSSHWSLYNRTSLLRVKSRQVTGSFQTEFLMWLSSHGLIGHGPFDVVQQPIQNLRLALSDAAHLWNSHCVAHGRLKVLTQRYIVVLAWQIFNLHLKQYFMRDGVLLQKGRIRLQIRGSWPAQPGLLLPAVKHQACLISEFLSCEDTKNYRKRFLYSFFPVTCQCFPQVQRSLLM